MEKKRNIVAKTFEKVKGAMKKVTEKEKEVTSAPQVDESIPEKKQRHLR